MKLIEREAGTGLMLSSKFSLVHITGNGAWSFIETLFISNLEQNLSYSF